MQKEVITVTIPKGKSFIKVLVDLGDRIKSSWIFIDEFVYRKLLLEAKATPIPAKNCVSLDSFNCFPTTKKVVISSDRPTKWKEVVEIDDAVIRFRNTARDPERILFFVTEIPY